MHFIMSLSLDHVYLRHASLKLYTYFLEPFLMAMTRGIPWTQFWQYFGKTHNLNQFSNLPLDQNSITPVQLSFPLPRLFLQPLPIPPACQLCAFNTPPLSPCLKSQWTVFISCHKPEVAEEISSVITPFSVRYEKIGIHLRETATNSTKIHSLVRKSEHSRMTQIQ